MSVRTRTESNSIQGTRKNLNTGNVATSTYINSSTCTDEVAPGDNAPFSVEKIVHSGGTITGTASHFGTPYQWDNYPADGYADAAITHRTISGRPNNGFLATELLKKTNPNRAELEAAVSLFELREIPGLVKDTYALRMKELFKFVPERVVRTLNASAKVHLMIRFGIMPLIGDIESCIEFQKSVDKRIKELDRLSTRGLKRTVHLWSGSATETFTSQVQSTGALISTRITASTTVEIKGHVRWYYSPHALLASKGVERSAVERLLRGKLDFVALWEAMPWSWLADYFLNVGSYLEANRNSLDVSHTQPRLMTRSKTLKHGARGVSSGGNLEVTPYSGSRDSKSRVIATPIITARAGILRGDQLSILGALSVLKVLR